MVKRVSILVFIAVLTATSLLPSAGYTNETTDVIKSSENWYDNLIFKNANYNFQLIRTMGHTYNRGADVGECISTARKIEDGNDRSWYEQWKKTGDRIYRSAMKFEKQGHVESAREAYFRASNYYRTAGFYLRSREALPHALKTWKKSKESFLKAIESLPLVEPVRIPYQNTTLPGYFLKSSRAKGKAPLVIVQTGFDGTGEELYFMVGIQAVRRGYHCLIFEGPGQGAVIREQDIPFRYDWEKVVTPVVDYALERQEVDPENLALIGYSMGGYLAPRAVAFEHRIKACVVDGGIYDLSEPPYRSLPPEMVKLIDKDPEKFNREIEEAMNEDVFLRWYINNGMWTFGVETPAHFMLKIKKYNLKGIADKIKCYMLVIDSSGDQLCPGQAKKLYQELKCPKEMIVFTREQTAQAHCQMGAEAISNEVIFNWLDKILRK